MTAFTNDETHKADLTYVREVMREPILSREDELTLASAWHDQHDEKALHLMIRAYSRLVVSAAVRFRHYGLPMGDLIQEGNLGLMQAATRFEPERGVRFSTYAKWWIRSSIQDYVLRNWSIVRTGSTAAQKQLFFNLRRLRAQLANVTAETMQPEDREKIAENLNVSIREVEDMENRLAAHDLSLSSPMSEGGAEEWLDSIPDIRPNPENVASDLFDATVRNHWIKSALRNLTPRERQIILSRHLSENPMTLEAIGTIMRISKERVRQLEARSLRKMRFYLLKNIHDVKEIL
ncbi:RNA polymerase factor sigma-32 [Candidatus Paracaedibacter symbiosus]|uniref:RNA polymerase factor sigma-32 n=1 Tax=Candidatus Paracaedibacter symbiosus TaxID=244582 RepID=UPI000509A973|nr:RNA polymerase factor sigma-32 [Candidatus Paracaedibacter symbiosus]